MDQVRLFGTDLHLLHNLDRQYDRERGSDLLTVMRGDRGLNDGAQPIDLETVSAVDNLKQALLLRFLTPRGELAKLGHPEYGSRLFELIGELNNDRTRNRAKLFVLEDLQREPRIKKIISVDVKPNTRERTQIDIDIRLRAIDEQTELNLVIPFSLEGGTRT